MNYPSLMFSANTYTGKISHEVFEDIKLTQLFNKDVIEAMRTLCGREDIINRQYLFKQLSDIEIHNHFKVLSKNMAEIVSLSESFENSRTDNERSFIFLSLFCAIALFYKNAAGGKATDGLFYNRFCSFFKDMCRKNDFMKAADNADELREKVNKVKANCLNAAKDKVKIIPDVPESYLSVIIKCANNLNIEINSFEETSRTLSSELLETILKLYPEELKLCKDFYDNYKSFYNPDLLKYYREFEFYLEITDITAKIKKMGMPVTYPVITGIKKVSFTSAYDITLLTKDENEIIPNDISFSEDEPFFYLTGANGGGKTTYLRTVGVSALMALNGCPVTCERGELCPLDSVFTHFPRDERFDHDGRFADEENRINYILNNLTSLSLTLLNETYSTTTEEKAIKLTQSLAERIYSSKGFGIYVTHQHGIGKTDIPFLNVVIDENDENRRTFKVAKRDSAGRSYAKDILKKYSLTKEALEERFGSLT